MMRRNLVIGTVCCAVLTVIWGKVLIRSKRWEEFPDVEFTFDCTDRAIGFYADLEFDCKIFHMCDAYGRRVPHICPNDTMFNQLYRVCDWNHKVNCKEAPSLYHLNDLIYEAPPPQN